MVIGLARIRQYMRRHLAGYLHQLLTNLCLIVLCIWCFRELQVMNAGIHVMDVTRPASGVECPIGDQLWPHLERACPPVHDFHQLLPINLYLRMKPLLRTFPRCIFRLVERESRRGFRLYSTSAMNLIPFD